MHSHRPGRSRKNPAKKINPATPSKPTPKPLTVSEQRSLLALQASGFGTWSWNVTNDAVELDSPSRALFGLPEKKRCTTRQELFSHLHPDDQPLAEEAVKHFVATGGDYEIVHRVIWPDKSVHWLRCKGRLIEENNATQVIGLVIEVPWLQRREEEHLEVEEKLRIANDELERRVEQRTGELERRTALVIEQARLLDLANDAIFVRGADDRVSYWNKGAERLYGWTRQEAMGQSTHDLLRTVFPIPIEEILNRDRWEGELRHTRKDGTIIPVASRWTTLRDSNHRPVGWLEINTDISARKASEQAAIRLSSRILKLQDEERRKMGRDLHDGLGQYLTIVKMNLDLLSIALPAENRPAELSKRLAECADALDKCIKETRTLSQLLHPPLLDESGLASAARWYVEGFAQRGNLRVDIDIPSDLPRLPNDAEIALFRVLQECLTNVYRHSGCSAVEVVFQSDRKNVTLAVKDNGHGIPDSPLRAFREGRGEVGVGLAGMRERLRQLNGYLEVKSNSEGTTVKAVLPFSPASERGADDAEFRHGSSAA